jgi:hypothetical protein
MFKRLDAFPKTREDLRQQSVLGGIITLVASIAAGLLFLGQIYNYCTGVTRHSLKLAESQWHPVQPLDATDQLVQMDFAHDGLSFTDPKFRQIHGISSKVITRPLLPNEWQKATGSSAYPSHKDLHMGCTFVGNYRVPRVGGAFTVSLSPTAWREASTILMMGFSFFGGRIQGSKVGLYNTT